MLTRLFQSAFQRSLQFFLLFFSAFFCVPFFSLSFAQQPSITSDGTLGTNVSINQSNYTINEGTIHGGNQFHSFGRFNVFEGERATFTGPNSINNIIGRVTGGNESFINGLLRSDINGANLYLLNPSGVLFGPNAQLDLSGSFHVSTADYLRLGDNGIFYAALSDNSVLTMDPPSAFGFLNGNPAGISIDGSRLTVPDGETLSVVGGDINVNGGVLKAPSGAIKVASMGSPGEINARTFDVIDTQLNISSTTLNQIDISNQANLDVSGNGAGKIVIRGGELLIEDSHIISNNYGNEESIDTSVSKDIIADDSNVKSATESKENSGNIEIDATKHVSLVNSLLSGETFADGGNGGDLTIETENLEVLDGAAISTRTYGSGNGGSIDVKADNILLSGANSSQGQASGIFTGSASNTTGTAGDLTITTGTLKVEAGAQIITSSSGTGKGGNINLNDRHIRLEGTDTGLLTGIFAEGLYGGDGGFLNIESQDLEILDGARISSGTFGSGKGGNIDVDADNILLSGTNLTLTQYWPSVIFTGTGEDTTGNAGDLKIAADTLKVEAGAIIMTSTFGSGKGGNINLNARHIWLTDVNADGINTSIVNPEVVYYSFVTGIAAEGFDGAGGSITIESENLEILNGATISSGTFGSGKGGNIDVNAGRVIISGEDPNIVWSSQIRAGSRASYINSTYNGNAGDIQINADYLLVEKKGFISTVTIGSGAGGEIGIDVNRLSLDSKGQIQSSTTGAGNGGKIRISATQFQQKGDAEVSAMSTGDGNAGDIHISSTDEFLLQDSAISVKATQSDGGNIAINNDHMVMLDNSVISASVRGGPGTVGANIRIESKFVILKDSSIIANAFEGMGGDIYIVNDVYMTDLNSKIEASSSFGIASLVGNPLSKNPAPLSEKFRSAVELLREPCLARIQGGKYNSLVVRGREAFPVGPGGLLPSPAYAR